MRLPLYFLSVLGYFWVPVFVLGALLLPRLDRLQRKAFWVALAVLYSSSCVMEKVYMSFDLWSFSEKTDPLLGIWVFGVPIEEFVYWFGAQAFVLVVYFGFRRLWERGGKLA